MKNIFKSIFIAAFPLLAIVVYVKSLQTILNNFYSIQDIGNLISSATVIIYFLGLFVISQARTSKNLTIYSVIVGIGFIFSIVPIVQFGTFNLFKGIYGVSLAIGWLAYVKWYSIFEGRDKSILKVGKKLPDLSFQNTYGEMVSTTTFTGNPTIYLFYRGNWCPLCMAQIKEIANQYKELEKRGVNMVFVSPQPHSHSILLSKKYNLGFHYLQDTDNIMAKKVGILAKNGLPTGFQALGYESDTVMPTVIITDKNGLIVFADLTDNYRVRPEPETFLKIIDEIK